MHVSDQKEQLRGAVKERLSRLTEDARADESRSICRRILEHLPEDAVVCAYSAMRTEARLDLALQTLLERGTPVYLPCFEENDLVFRRYTGPDQLSKGPLAALEPPRSAEELKVRDKNLIVLVPGLAFDRQGGRLGRGNGGYDRWFQYVAGKAGSLKILGVALDCQVVASVPVEAHDYKVDAIATAREYIECTPAD